MDAPGALLHAVFSFQFRNPQSAFEYANLFMEETKYQFLKPFNG